MSKIIRLSGSETESIKLDLKDKKIMAILVDDARISLTQLAKKVGLKRETVDYRIKRLLEQKYITGFVPMINFKLLGYSHFEILLLLNEVGEKRRKELIEELSNLPYTKSVLEFNDRWDIKHTIIAKDLEDLERCNSEIQKNFGKYILEKEIVVSLKEYIELSISDLFIEGSKKQMNRNDFPSSVNLDAKDILILAELSNDSRQSTYQISDKVGLSPDGVGLRIKKMINNGVILKFITLFDNSKSPLYWYTFATKLNNFNTQIEGKIVKLFKENPKIMSARKTIGGWDLLFSIVASSQKEVHEATKAIKAEISDYIKSYEVWFVYKEPYFTPFPKIISSSV